MKPLSQSQTGLSATAFAVSSVVLFSLAAAAQDRGVGPAGRTPMAPATGAAPQQAAPIGHRQPTLSTLPPGVRKEEETTGNRARDDLGPMQSICTRC